MTLRSLPGAPEVPETVRVRERTTKGAVRDALQFGQSSLNGGDRHIKLYSCRHRRETVRHVGPSNQIRAHVDGAPCGRDVELEPVPCKRERTRHHIGRLVDRVRHHGASVHASAGHIPRRMESHPNQRTRERGLDIAGLVTSARACAFTERDSAADSPCHPKQSVCPIFSSMLSDSVSGIVALEMA